MFSRTIRIALVCLFGLFALAAVARAGDAKTMVYFFTHSSGCDCTKRECKLAEPIAAEIQTGLAAGFEYRHLDYGEQPETVKPLMEKYKLFSFPALLVVTPQGSSLYQAQGKLRRQDVLAKLREIGVVKETP
ncbi:MAG: hypothetical protein IT350_20850 [Deltaproteobacteria bacterium]|nr:hypothetical protein [Deltaproteobacteria bacterium]